MQAFARLYAELDETTKTSEKVDALVRYFAVTPPADAAWALYFLSGRKLRQVIGTPKLRAWALEATGLPEWLFGESYDAVGDFAETVALLLPDNVTTNSTKDTKDAKEREEQENLETISFLESSAESPSDLRALRALRGSDLPDRSLANWVEQRLLPLRNAGEKTQRAGLFAAWNELDSRERFIWNKLITGGFRVGVSQLLVTRALAKVSGIEQSAIAHRLMGEWQPTAEFYARLLAADTQDADASQPYPFFLASPLETDPAELGDLDMWQAEWKWDGIRAQLVRRAEQTFVWSRGEELVTERFPELAALGALLPDGTVIDGEILSWSGDAVLPFAQLQQRIGRKTVTRKVLGETPVVLLAYDLLELDGQDVRTQPLHWRRAQLEKLVGSEDLTAKSAKGLKPEELTTKSTKNTKDEKEKEERDDLETRFPSVSLEASSDLRALRVLRGKKQGLLLSPIVEAASWEELAQLRDTSREQNVEGLMLKRRDSPYRVGRTRGDWWKWKIAPYTVDAVLINAQRGSGKRASLYSDYTFGIWDDGKLVPFTKAYSGLTDAEIRKVDAFVRRNTVEKFGPVRSVKPELVFELAFEGIQRSTRHKSGIAVRFPRMLRWRTDKQPEDADTVETVRALLPKE